MRLCSSRPRGAATMTQNQAANRADRTEQGKTCTGWIRQTVPTHSTSMASSGTAADVFQPSDFLDMSTLGLDKSEGSSSFEIHNLGCMRRSFLVLQTAELRTALSAVG